MEKYTGLLSNGIIWFGVAISVSEIQAGIQIGSMSTPNQFWIPLIIGHIIGGILLFLVGLIGARVRLNAMETLQSTFGSYGSKFFATLNLLQLIAWVAVLNSQGASVLAGLNLPISFPTICIILSAIIAIWVYVGIQRSEKITQIMMVVLTILLLLLTVNLYGAGTSNSMIGNNTLSFWNIFEISIAMPISWLPVISDYTKDVEKPVKATLISALAYTISSLWMYFIGIEIVGIGLNYDIAEAILFAGLGSSGIIIVALSTVTSNFVAANSGGESAKAIINKLNPRTMGVVVSALSAVLAISGIMDHYINFLYLIASVFAPMAAVLLVSFYIDKNDERDVMTWYWNIFSWFAGFVTYQLTITLDSVFLGPTLLAVIVSAILTYARVIMKKEKNSELSS